MLSYNDRKDEIQLKLFDSGLWYAYYKNYITISSGFLKQESLVDFLNKESFENNLKESITKWIDSLFMTPYNQSTKVIVLEELYKDKEIAKVIDSEKNNRLSFHIAFSHNRDELIHLLINNKNISEKKYEIHTVFSNGFINGTSSDHLLEYKKITNTRYLILENLYDNNECFKNVSGHKKISYYKEMILTQMKELNEEIEMGNQEIIKQYKNNFLKTIKKLKINPEKNSRTILNMGLEDKSYNSLMILYNELNLKKKTLFVEKVKSLVEKSSNKSNTEFYNELNHLYNIEKQYHDLKKITHKDNEINSMKIKKI